MVWYGIGSGCCEASSILSFLTCLEGIRDLAAAVNGVDGCEEGATSDDEAEGAGGLVAGVVCEGVSLSTKERGGWGGGRDAPDMTSLTSSRTRFMRPS